MIQLNAVTTSKGGLAIPSGVVLDVRPHFTADRVDDGQGGLTIQYNVAFDAVIYKDLASYEAGDGAFINEAMQEYNIGYVAFDVDIHALTSVDDMLDIYKTHIEDGNSKYSGIGQGNAAIVWPFQP